MTALVQRWLAAATVFGALTYLAWRSWRSWRAAFAARRDGGCGPGCGCE